jgi:hypothetical protein
MKQSQRGKQEDHAKKAGQKGNTPNRLEWGVMHFEALILESMISP